MNNVFVQDDRRRAELWHGKKASMTLPFIQISKTANSQLSAMRVILTAVGLIATVKTVAVPIAH